MSISTGEPPPCRGTIQPTRAVAGRDEPAPPRLDQSSVAEEIHRNCLHVRPRSAWNGQPNGLGRWARSSKEPGAVVISPGSSYVRCSVVLGVQPRLQLSPPLRQTSRQRTQLQLGDVENFKVIEFVEVKESQRGPLRIGGGGNPNRQLRR